MSNKIGVSTSKGFYEKDSMLPLSVEYAQNAQNAQNSILNSNGTYSGFTKDENGVLKGGDIIISQKKLLWQGTWGGDTTQPKALDLSTYGINEGDLMEVEVYHHSNSREDCIKQQFRMPSTNDTTGGTTKFYHLKPQSNGIFVFYATISFSYNPSTGYYAFTSSKCQTLQITETGISNLTSDYYPKLTKIYKIIE